MLFLVVYLKVISAMVRGNHFNAILLIFFRASCCKIIIQCYTSNSFLYFFCIHLDVISWCYTRFVSSNRNTRFISSNIIIIFSSKTYTIIQSRLCEFQYRKIFLIFVFLSWFSYIENYEEFFDLFAMLFVFV